VPPFRRLTSDSLNLNSLGTAALDTLKFENAPRELSEGVQHGDPQPTGLACRSS
jgi:hypothetical protein